MENNFREDFFTKEQLQSIIHVPVYEVISDLDEYIYYDGVLSDIPFDDDYVKAYVIGFIKVKKELAKNHLGKYINNKDGSTRYNYSYICGDYCSRPDLTNTTDLMTSTGFKDNEQEIVYNFYEFKKLCDTIRLPIKNKSEIKFIKAFNYDVQLVNQKSNYTLIEASRIAANLSVNPNGFEATNSTLIHYQEVLSDCVKDQHQNNFHLITKELWVHTHDEYEPVSHKYDNGTRLKISANINLEMTIISKLEFIRWCDFMDIETGLTNDEIIVEESTEALLLENEKLKKEIGKLHAERFNKMCDEKPVEETQTSFPPELQLAIDAYVYFYVNQSKDHLSKDIQKWLKAESEKRGITHQDSGKNHKGLSDTKLKRIASMIRT